MSTTGTPVAAHGQQQRRRPPTERLVRKLSGDRVARCALSPAAAAPVVRLDNLAREYRSLGFETLAGHDEAELVQAAEGGQIRAGEASTSGNVRHVEVFRMGSVRTSILRRPRPLSRYRRAVIYTLNWEEPL